LIWVRYLQARRWGACAHEKDDRTICAEITRAALPRRPDLHVGQAARLRGLPVPAGGRNRSGRKPNSVPIAVLEARPAVSRTSRERMSGWLSRRVAAPVDLSVSDEL
jgi:hypothetical protein